MGVCWEIWFEWAVRFSETRKLAQKLSRKDLGCNDPQTGHHAQGHLHSGFLTGLLAKTRKPAQKLPRKDLGRNDPKPVITPKATYVPVSKRAGLRS
ncbi:hypothetical protein LC1917_0482 [Lacticaseibacillus paracasei NRIC 1917]|uniref:Uncharacterized protein n=1 Tax=Lacticaseibacillus paracasei NRIC 0644 TaxID=1435038 RepID=A0A0C9P0E1_LACPA|nr:hypothetical protein LC0644_2384 [Lacticaseibacillus paracasei NRIC 0644]GAN38605.1 hypothetical protein LC1917_0482 [Lacticaseibacillus paracasei NRIC 1917]